MHRFELELELIFPKCRRRVFYDQGAWPVPPAQHQYTVFWLPLPLVNTLIWLLNFIGGDNARGAVDQP